MNQHLQKILDFIQQDEKLTADEKALLIKAAKSTDSDLSIAEFKLDRTEKVKRTTAILLEETIEELEQKRKSVEAQNKELEIEASLEKVRSRSLAVQKSDEFKKVVEIVFEKLRELGIRIDAASINVFIDNSNDLDVYISGKNDGDLDIRNFRLMYSDELISNDRLESQQAGTDFFSKTYSKEEKDIFFKHQFEHSEIKQVPAEIRKRIFESEQYTISMALSKHSMIVVNNFDGKTLSEYEVTLLKRFAKVFEQAYIRFLDLKKAEAQAREGEIELALERIRARTMAMQHSDELGEVSFLLDGQVRALGIKTWGCAFNIYGDSESTEWFSSEGGTMPTYKTPREEVFLRIYEAGKTGSPLYIEKFVGDSCIAHYDYLCSLPGIGDGLNEAKKNGVLFPTQQFDHAVYFKYGYLMFITLQPAPEAHEIFIRFAKVFEQTYTRFLDLQKAEAQARDAEIELALERVRARTMAMQHSDELADAATLLFQQVQSLGTSPWTCSFNIWGEEKKYATAWNGIKGGFGRPFKTNSSEDVFFRFYEEAQKGEKLYIEEIGGENLEQHYNYLSTVPGVRETLAELKAAGVALPTFQIFNIAYFTQGYLMFITYEPVPELWDIFQRFAKTFEQTYTRFLDLQKAEAQAKEAQIETALEKVRSRSLAMQKSEELKEVIQVVYEQFVHLNINTEHTGFVIDYKERDDRLIWVASKHGVPSQLSIPYFDSEYYNSFNEAKDKGLDFFPTNLNFEDKNNFYRELFKYIPDLPAESKEFYFSCSGLAISTVLLDNVGLYIENFEGIPYSNEDNAILMRFGKVFQQTYTRFLDLQKAEAQTRAAQIELAVERVRAKALAMHNSTQILEVVATLRNEMLGLEIPGVVAATIYLQQEEGYIRMWDLSSVIEMEDGFHVALDVKFNLAETDPGLYIRRVWNNSDNYFVEKQEDEDLAITIEWLRQYYPKQADEVQQFIKTNPWKYLLHPTIKLAHGKMSVDIMDTQPPAEMESIMLKMGAAFDLAYKRFLDLQKSEIQIREAQIELGLERVRARTMAMQDSGELADTASILFQQIKNLGFETWSCGFCTWQTNDMVEVWMGADAGGLLPPMMIPYKEEPTHKNIYEASLTAIPAHDKIWEGKALQEHYSFLKTIPSVNEAIHLLEKSGLSLPERQCYYVGFFDNGYLLLITKEPNDELKDLGKRFANVFNQTYTRFLDLQKAEAQAREAIIETSLEKVRSRTLAMQRSDELAETAAVVFQQLIQLGIAPNRLYIAIIEDKNGQAEFWITTEDGSKVSTAFHTNLNDNISFKKMLVGLKEEKKSLIIDMQGDELQQYFNYLTSINVTFKAGLTQKRRLQHVAYFAQGFIGIASPDDQAAETMLLLERFAAVFNLTFTRFSDLKIAEAHAVQAEEDLIKLQTEKKRAEVALTNLQAAQKQLVQSEKMASLGELTAGIAHEIQNPLNFVNNFSEVSVELIKEMMEEAEKGNTEEVKAIVDDIIQNLEKINHHGKRADAIVKGMLQHSRSSNGVKEPTDINALCDEYLRLSYHGLRAKDKSFNATIKTDFDKSIEKINIIPQDIGRVIMNLLTNAFYAVNERTRSAVATPTAVKYEPTVSITTKKITNKVIISVTDNGNGIPTNIIDKIFQPFFTTKPTGQGTGLGLSLSYDIITKGHGGEFKVETKESEGSAFTIIFH